MSLTLSAFAIKCHASWISLSFIWKTKLQPGDSFYVGCMTSSTNKKPILVMTTDDHIGWTMERDGVEVDAKSDK